MSELLPQRPTSPNTSHSSWLSILFTGVMFVAGGSLLVVLPVGFLGPAIVLGGGLFLIVLALHYVIWGYWVARALARHTDEDEDSTT